MDRTDLGDRMKSYERRYAGVRALPGLPVCARIDGKRFSRFTHGLARPYDERLSRLMVEVTTQLVRDTSACIGYTQSDEITLVLWAKSERSSIYCDGRIQKLTSILASMASVHFNRLLGDYIPEKAGQLAFFDCRVWELPSRAEAVNVLVWREMDASKNSISMAARSVYSHKALDQKNGNEMQEMLWQKGINWNDYPAFFKRGTYVRRRRVERSFSAEELERLPPQHEARRNPDLSVERTVVEAVELPRITQIVNREAMVFDGAEPIVAN